MMDDDVCVFCKGPLDAEPTATIGAKGVEGIRKAATERNETVIVRLGQKVHIKCRKDFTKPSIIKAVKRNEMSPEYIEQATLRSSHIFSFKTDCLFCGKSLEKTNRISVYKETHTVKTRDIDIELQRVSNTIRNNDAWAVEVLGRIEFSRDLHASDSVYHQACSVRFRTDKDKIPEEFSDGSVKRRRISVGRPTPFIKEDAFNIVISYLEENDNELVTLQDLVTKMQEYIDEGIEGYSVKWMRKRLCDHYGSEIVITSYERKQNVVTLKRTAAKILYEYHKLPREDDPEKEKIKIVEVAAKLIRNDIKNIHANKDTYPGEKEMGLKESSDFLPETLRTLLSSLVVGKDSQQLVNSLGQALIQATRPKMIIAPLQLGLGVQLHHHFASRYLIDTLHKYGFCSGYPEIQRYEQNAACSNDTELPTDDSEKFIQYVADNVDHNIRTIDGHGTFHGMGIIATTTPGGHVRRLIPRNKITVAELQDIGKINVHFYSQTEKSAMKYESLSNLPLPRDKHVNIDILWKSTWLLRPDRTSWSGVMQMINNKSAHPGRSSVIFMPMIDMNPSDESCIYSTLQWVSLHAKRYDATPVLTFDQPLWFKASMIVNAEQQDTEVSKVVLRLGGFHTEMSYLGAVGHIMTDTGLLEVLSTVYAEKAVGHILTGKAISRAIRGHGLVQMALNSLIVSEMFALGPHVMDQFTTETSYRDEIKNIVKLNRILRSSSEQCEDPTDSLSTPILDQIQN